MKTNETFCVNSKGNLIEIGIKAYNLYQDGSIYEIT